MGKFSIAQWDEADRPREKLMAHGADVLSNAELLAILIGSGSASEDAVSLMQRILSDHKNSLNRLGRLSIHDLCQYTGIGPAKAIAIIAACELGKRRVAEPAEQRPQLVCAEAVAAVFRPKLQDLPHEEIHVALLNNRLQLMGTRLIGRGGIAETVADVRLILREALLAGASAIALCHNHPSGNPQPSGHDDSLTQRLKQAADTMNIRLVDHVIVCENTYYSYNDNGKL